MDYVKAPEFIRPKIIQGLKNDVVKLGKIRADYLKFGNSKEVLETIFKAEKLIHMEINFQMEEEK